MHACMHTYIHFWHTHGLELFRVLYEKHTYLRTRTDVHTCTDTCIPTYICNYLPVWMHTHACARTYTHRYKHVHLIMVAHTHTHTYIYIYIHTYLKVHTYILAYRRVHTQQWVGAHVHVFVGAGLFCLFAWSYMPKNLCFRSRVPTRPGK